MEQFLIEIPHAEQNCVELIRLLRAQGDLGNFEWGCQSGVHTGWGLITADNEAEACLVVPPLMRRKARVVRVASFQVTTVVGWKRVKRLFQVQRCYACTRPFPAGGN